MESKPVRINPDSTKNVSKIQHLSSRHVAMIDEALSVVGEFGEVRLVINRGRLHFLIMQKSFNPRNYAPDMIIKEFARL